MAYFVKRDENTYRLFVDVGQSGKRKIKSKTIKITDRALLRTKKRLQDHIELELRKFQLELMQSNLATHRDMTFSEFVELWLNRHVYRELEEKSQQNYLFHIERRILPYFGNMRMSQITKQHILDYLDYLHSPEAAFRGKQLGASTLLYNYRVLRSLFNYAAEWEVIEKSPMLGITKPKDPDSQPMQVYDEAELAQLFEALAQEPSETRCIVMFAVTCGMRRGEIAGLEWKHVDLDARTVEIKQSITMNKGGQPVIKRPKTRKSIRKIAMPMILVDQLMEFRYEWLQARRYARSRWDGKGEFLFCHESGQPHDPHWITDLWIKVRKKHNLKPIRFHDLRHTAATWMIKQNIHPKAIANRLGHINIKTTMDVYSHVLESVDQMAASVFDEMPTGGLPKGVLISKPFPDGDGGDESATHEEKRLIKW